MVGGRGGIEVHRLLFDGDAGQQGASRRHRVLEACIGGAGHGAMDRKVAGANGGGRGLDVVHWE